ncbi:MAG: TetR/AcrR family transcriptional regulator [Burkholderiales bacterium]
MPVKGQTNRQRIIDAANALFYRKGYNPTSFSEIADAAGIPRGNFYYYFKSKDDILAAVIDDRLAQIKAMLAEWDAQYAGPREKLKRYVAILRNSAEDAARYGCPMGSLNVELGKTQLAMQSKAKEMFDAFLDWLTPHFAALGHSADARDLALHLLGRAQGIALLTNVYSDTALLEREAATLDGWIDGL